MLEFTVHLFKVFCRIKTNIKDDVYMLQQKYSKQMLFYFVRVTFLTHLLCLQDYEGFWSAAPGDLTYLHGNTEEKQQKGA